jgi:FkbM family methyltransferase
MNAGIERVINGDAFFLCPEFAYAEPVRSEWEPTAYRRFKSTLGPGMTVIDVGASFGLYSVAAARVVGPSGRVYAFEPASRTAAALRLHLQWNGVADQVEVIEAAAADRTGSAVFWEQETSFVASLIEDAARREERRYRTSLEPRRVPTFALDHFCRERALEPAVIKVDVEGSEARVLQGSHDLLQRARAVVFLELHPGIASGDGGAVDMLHKLTAPGWACEQLEDTGATEHYVCWPARRRPG